MKRLEKLLCLLGAAIGVICLFVGLAQLNMPREVSGIDDNGAGMTVFGGIVLIVALCRWPHD